VSSQALIRYLKWIVAIVIILATIGLFAWYISNNPEVLETITSLNPIVILLLTIGYVLTLLANAFVLYCSLHLLGKRVPLIENVALTGYSSIVNFFGPLQSGPGFRAVYLKRMHSVKLRDFLFVSIIFYGFFGLMNGLTIGAVAAFRFGQIAALLWSIFALAIFLLAGWMIHKKYPDLIPRLRLFAKNKNFWLVGLGAFLLIAATVFIYHTELAFVYSGVSIFQSIVYTAAANLALFVSLTPGALGIRESFLILSQQLHNIPSDAIVSASVIDRAFYVIFLLVMFVLLLAVDAKRRLRFSADKLAE